MKCKECGFHFVPDKDTICNFCHCKAKNEEKYGVGSCDPPRCDHCNPEGGEFCQCGVVDKGGE